MGISLKTRARAWAPGHECEGRPRPQGGAGRLSVTAGTRRVVSTGMGMHARARPQVCVLVWWVQNAGKILAPQSIKTRINIRWEWSLQPPGACVVPGTPTL